MTTVTATKFVCDDADFFGTIVNEQAGVTTINLVTGGVLELPTDEIIAVREGIDANTTVKSDDEPVITESKKGSKKERAIELFKANPEVTRGTMLSIFMSQLDMSKAGASTYYASIKKDLK